MHEINIRRIIFTSDADMTLRMMKARTGLLPNILCRIALCLSLDEPGLPRLIADDPRSAREINRYTLLGEYDAAFMALTKTRLHADGVDPEKSAEYFVAHLHRGVNLLPNRVKSLADLQNLISQ